MYFDSRIPRKIIWNLNCASLKKYIHLNRIKDVGITVILKEGGAMGTIFSKSHEIQELFLWETWIWLLFKIENSLLCDK